VPLRISLKHVRVSERNSSCIGSSGSILSKSIVESIGSASALLVASVSSLVIVIRMFSTGISKKLTMSLVLMYLLEKQNLRRNRGMYLFEGIDFHLGVPMISA